MAEIQSPRRSDTDIAYILYAMHAIAPFTLWTLAAIAVFFGYVSRDRVRGTYVESHLEWLARTFWFGLAGFVILCVVLTISILGIPLVFLGVPWFVMTVWYLYRIFRGWLLMRDGQPAPV